MSHQSGTHGVSWSFAFVRPRESVAEVVFIDKWNYRRSNYTHHALHASSLPLFSHGSGMRGSVSKPCFDVDEDLLDICVRLRVGAQHIVNRPMNLLGGQTLWALGEEVILN